MKEKKEEKVWGSEDKERGKKRMGDRNRYRVQTKERSDLITYKWMMEKSKNKKKRERIKKGEKEKLRKWLLKLHGK